MKKNSQFYSLTPSEAVRVDPTVRAKINDGIKEKKAFLSRDEKCRHERQKVVNKNRRRFLDMIGKAGVSTALLRTSSVLTGVFASRMAMAQNEPWANKNVVFCYLNNGCSPNEWLPAHAGQMNWVSGPYGDEGVANFCNFRQVNVHVEGHASARQSMGDPQTQWHLHKPTTDEQLANVFAGQRPYSSMYIGAEANHGINRGEPYQLLTCSSLGIPIDGPQATFDRFFNRQPPDTTDTTFRDMYAAQYRTLQELRSKLGQDEYQRVDDHLAALQELEQQLDQQSGGNPIDINACKPQNINFGDEAVSRGRAQADIIAAALKCELTNVITLQVGDNKAYYQVPRSGHGGEVHGGIAHGGNYNAFNQVMRYHHEVPAYLIKKLANTTDATGTPLINNTVVAVVNCMGDGSNHGPHNSPWVLATKMNGFNTGFSSQNAGDTYNFHQAIPKGLGIPDNLLPTTSNNDIGLLG